MIIEDRPKSVESFPSNEWESKNSKKGILRPRFMSAADYVFYLRRHLVAERRRNDPTVGHPGDETLTVGIPRLSFLLRRLEEDIHSSYLSFLEEFVSEIHEGVGCLLSILRICQERQKGAGLFTYATCSRAKLSLINKGTIDEFYCLLCLKACSKSSAAVEMISDHKTGLSTIASSITSSHMKSRIVAIELLTVVSRSPESGSNRVLEAMTTVRILFGESVRFKFLVSVLNSNLHSASGLETATLIFFNTLLDQCAKMSDRVRIQSELEEAGLDVESIEKQLRTKLGNSTHRIWSEIEKWRELNVDLRDALHKHQENDKLKKEVQLLRDALKRLRDERKGILSLHKQMKGQWTNMEQRLHDLALKSRVMSTTSSTSSDDESPTYGTVPASRQQPADSHDSELDEILIDIPTLLPTDKPSGDSGISSNSAPDSEPEWQYPDIRQGGGRVRFNEAPLGRRSASAGRLADIPLGTVVLQPGQNKTKCADILGVQNITPPPLPQRPKTPLSNHKKMNTKRRSLSSENKGKSLLPRSMKTNQKATRSNSQSTGNLIASLSPEPPLGDCDGYRNHSKPTFKVHHKATKCKYPNTDVPVTSPLPDLSGDMESYRGNNKLWNKRLQPPPPPSVRPPSQMGSSLDGMIHREIAKAIRDRHALFDP